MYGPNFHSSYRVLAFFHSPKLAHRVSSAALPKTLGAKSSARGRHFRSRSAVYYTKVRDLHNNTHYYMVRWSRIRRATRSPIYTMAPKGRHPGPRWFWRHDIGCLEDVPGLMGCGGKAFSQGHCIWDTQDLSGKTRHQHLQRKNNKLLLLSYSMCVFYDQTT